MSFLTVEGEVLPKRLVADGPAHELGQQLGVALHCRVFEARHLTNLEPYTHWMAILYIAAQTSQRLTDG